MFLINIKLNKFVGLFLTAAKINKCFIKVVYSYSHALEFVPDCYITQETCDKVLDTHSCILRKQTNKKKTQKK